MFSFFSSSVLNTLESDRSWYYNTLLKLDEVELKDEQHMVLISDTSTRLFFCDGVAVGVDLEHITFVC